MRFRKARRLAAEPVGVVFAARELGAELGGLPELVVEGLRERDARALLDSALAGPLDARVRELIVAETRGNPLALLELPRGLTQAELAGGFGLPGAAPLTGPIEESFRRQLEALPADTRRLMVLAAADPSGNPSLMWRAAGQLGIPVQAARSAQEAGLADFGIQVRFRHPLVRSVAYQSASAAERQAPAICGISTASSRSRTGRVSSPVTPARSISCRSTCKLRLRLPRGLVISRRRPP